MTFLVRVVTEPDFLQWVKVERQTILRIKCPPTPGNALRISARNISWNTSCLAISPGQLTGSFVRRFFKADYFRLEGDPSLAGQGFDETPPTRAEGPIARMAEQGFLTEAIGLMLRTSGVMISRSFFIVRLPKSDFLIWSKIKKQSLLDGS